MEVGIRGYSMDHLVGEYMYEDIVLNALADFQPVELSENRGDGIEAWSDHHNPRCCVEHALDAHQG